MVQNDETARRPKKRSKVWGLVFCASAALAFLPLLLHKEDSALILLLPLGVLAMIISGIIALVMLAKEKKGSKDPQARPADANKKPASPPVVVPEPSPASEPTSSEAQAKEKQAEPPAVPSNPAPQSRAKLSYIPLESIPAVEVTPDGSTAKKRLASEVKEISLSNITKRSSLKKLGDFVVIDTETTGLNPVNCDIVEVSAIRFRDFKPVEQFSTLCGSNKGIPAEARKVNGITDAMIEGKPLFGQIAGTLQAFIGSDNLVGHNLEFDLKFIVRHGVDVLGTPRKYYDTWDLAKRQLKGLKKKWDPDLERYEYDYDADYDVEDFKLRTLAEYFRLPYHGSHRSLEDAYTTGLLFKRLAELRTE